MASALIPVADGFEEIEFVTVIDVLRRGGVEAVSASVGDSLEVAGAHGVAMRADAKFADVESRDFDAIILPGGGHGVENLRLFAPLAGRLAKQKASGRLVCAICAAPVLLVEAGILDPETHITCYPSCAPELDRPWASAPVVEDGCFITGQAPGSASLFALVVLKALCGETVARKVAAGMVSDVL